MSVKSLVYLALERLLAPLTDRIVCISEAERTSALQNDISAESKLALIPNGIDVDAVLRAVPRDKRELGFPADAFVVGMVGRLSPQKAPDTFVKAALLIREKIQEACFVIVGDGELRSDTEAFARSHSIPLFITGWTDEPYAFLKTFDVGLLLSRWEGFGLAVAEYMAARKNVVASRIDAIPTLIDDGRDGLLCEVDHPEDVCEKVFYLYTHPKESKMMREKAFEKVCRQYDISRVARQHVEMFNQLVGGGKI